MEQKRFFRLKGYNWPLPPYDPRFNFWWKNLFCVIFDADSEKHIFSPFWDKKFFYPFLKMSQNGLKICFSESASKITQKRFFNQKLNFGSYGGREGQLDPFGRKNLFCFIFDVDFEKHIFSPFWDYMIFACVFSKKKVA